MTEAFAAVTYPSADGRLELYARDYPGSGPALLLMHGLSRNSADFGELAERLCGRFRVVVPDQRGRGRSQYDPDPANYTPATYCQDMSALIKRLKLERPILIGTSMGGLMAMLMAAMAPAGFRGIVLNDVGPVVDTAGLVRIASYVGKSPPVTDWESAAAYCRETQRDAFPGYDVAQWQAFARRIFREDAAGVPRLAYDPSIAAGLAGATPTATPDLWAIWPALTGLPMLVIRGALSDILSAATVQEMASRHPQLVHAEVSGVGHTPMLDEPQSVTAIEAYLRQF